MKYIVFVSYSLALHEWGSLDSCLEKILGTSGGGGTGFGERDLDWSFDTKKEAEEAAEKIRALELKGVYVSIKGWNNKQGVWVNDER